ncbi:clock-controlled gene-4 protein [Trichoderma harzianum]|uniref:Clock-controlled gene-4 protein n=1 Tax=Trichoderma harzianum TaxID=5544 RepID=A0A0F9X7R8_TRIHA|nr:clock-controlled gene-4 protein [Trichoderma harzianum]
MKFLATVGVLASAAIAAPNPEPFCSQPGQACWKVSHAASAFVDTMKSVGGLESRDVNGAIPNEIALAAINGLDQLSTMILYASEDPSAFRPFGENGTETVPYKRDATGQLDRRWCYLLGMPCWIPKRDAEVNEEKRWCYRIGESCWIPKRDEAEVQEEKREIEIKEDKRWCYRIGQSCWIPRSNAEAQEDKREVEVQEEKRWCYRIGESCWIPKRTDEISEEKRGCFQNGGDCQKAKRVAEAVLAATIEGDEKRSVEVESPEKRMCNSVGQPCWKAERDLETIQNLARSAIEGMY